MSEKRRSDEQPWQPTIEKLPTFNPFANDQNPGDDSEFKRELDEMDDESSEEIKPPKPL